MDTGRPGALPKGVPEGQTIPEKDLREGLSELVWHTLCPVALALACIFGALTLLYFLFLPPALVPLMSLTAGATSLLLLGLHAALRKGLLTPKHANATGALMAGLALGNAVLHLFVTRNPLDTTNLGLAVLGAGFVVFSVPWLVALSLLALGGWGVALWSFGEPAEWVTPAFTLSFLLVLSGVVLAIRLRVYRRLLHLQAEEARLREHLSEAAAEARANEHRFRALAEAAYEGVAIHGPDGLRDVNDRLGELLGYTREELLRMDLLDLVAPEAREVVRAHGLSEATTPCEALLLRKDGTRLPVELRARVLGQGSEPLRVVSVHDLTARKQVESTLEGAVQAAQESEERFRSLVGNIPGVVYRCEVGKPWRMHYISDNALEVTGYRAADFLSGRIAWGEFVHPEDLPGLTATVAKTIAERMPYDVEYRIVRPDGSVAWLFERGRASYDSHGRPTHLDGALFDITSRKEAESALRRREAQLAQAQQVARLGGWEWDTVTDEIVWSREAYEILGVPQGQPPGDVEGVLALMAPEDRARVWETAQRARDLLEPLQYQARIESPDGSTRVVSVRGEVVEQVDGRPRRMAGVVQDITPWYRHQEALERAMREREAIMRAVPDPVFMLDAEGKVIGWNDEVERALGMDAEGLRDKPALDFFPEDQVPLVGEAIERTLLEGFGEVEAQLPVAGGALRTYHFRSLRVLGPDGALLGIAGVGRDVTEQRRMEEALRESEGKLRHILENSTNLFYAHTPDHVLTYVSPQAKEFLGCDPEEAAASWQDFITENPVNLGGIESTERALRTGTRQPPYELQLVRKDGRIVWVEVNEAPVMEDGKVTGIVGSLTDVTERKRAEEELRKSERDLQEYIDSMRTFSAKLSPDGRIIAFSHAAALAAGVTKEEVRGTPFVEGKWFTFDPVVVTRVRDALARARQGETVVYQEKVLSVLGVLDIDFNLTPVLDAEGGVKYIVAEGRDITAQKRAEDAVRQSEASFRAIAEAIPNIVWTAAPDGLLDYVNKRAVEDLGRPFDQIIREGWQSILHPDDLPGALVVWSRCLRTGEPYRCEFRLMSAGGDYRWHLAQALAVRDSEGNITKWFGTTTDITERRELEETLEESRSALTEYVNALTTMNAKVAPDGTMMLVGSAAIVVSGEAPEALVGRSFLDGPWWTFDPEVHARVRGAFARAVAGDAVAYEERIKVASGRVLVINFGLTPILGSDGHVKYVIAEGRDVTALKEAEARLLDQRDRLEAATRELRAANRELEAFSYSVSHDLRAPLRGIQYLAEALVEDYSHHLDDEGRETLKRLRTEAERMSDLIEDLLNLSRITRGDLHRETVDLTALAESIVSEIRRREPARDVDIHVERGLTARADPRLLRVVLENLLGNAWKYTSKRPQARIVLGVQHTAGAPDTLFVRDNGAGFDMAKAGRLFAPFQRLHSASEFQGTGIGLATVRRIVERHGGHVWAQGVPGVGATFYFTLEPGPVPGAERATSSSTSHAA